MAQLADECPEAPTMSLRMAVQKAVRDASVSGIVCPWVCVPTQANVTGYPLEHLICEGMSIKFIRHVEWCGCCIDCVEECKPCPSGYRVDDMHHITLVGSAVPQCNAECQLRVNVVLQPTNQMCDLPTDLLERHDDLLLDGALYHLLKQKGKKWTDLRLASSYDELFKGKIASTKCLVQQKYNDCDTRMKGARVL